MKRLLLLVIVTFLFTVGNNAQSSFNADDVAALKSLMSTGVNPGLLEKVWAGQDAERPSTSDENDSKWNQVDWKTDIKGLTWNGSGELLKIDWNNFGAPETDYITGLLSVADLKHLTAFHCYNNGLTGLILKNLPELNGIEVGYNNIISFMTDATPQIDSIDLINNKLTKLTLTDYSNLEYLNCSHNELTSLELINLTALEHLDCTDNELTVLDASGLSELETFFCYHNKLEKLKLSSRTEWNELSCGDNNLPFAQLPVESAINGRYYYTPQVLVSAIQQGDSYTFDQGLHTGVISVASCTDEKGEKVTGYNMNNNIFTPPAAFSGLLKVYVTHSSFPQFEAEEEYMELHLTVKATEKYNVILPEVEGLHITPNPGTYEVGKGDSFEFTLILSEGYEGSDIKVYSNNDLLEPVQKEAIRFLYKIENITKAITIKLEVLKKNVHKVTVPEVEGVSTEPTPGTYDIKEGESFEFTLTLLEEYDQSDVKVYANGDLLQPNPKTHSDAVIRSFIYTIENVTEAISITIEGVQKNNSTGIESTMGYQGYRVYTEGSMLYIDTQQQNRFAVYGTDGKKYAGGEISVGVTSVSLPKGIYIVLIGESRLKIAIGN